MSAPRVDDRHVQRLLALARRVQSKFPKFYLAGGTAVMFRHRHRVSVDLDFFSRREFSFRTQESRIRAAFKVESAATLADNLDVWVDRIRISFVFFPFPNLDVPRTVHGVRAASDFDIFLNKVYAAGRRVDEKDPRDAAFLYALHQWPLKRSKAAFEKKFAGQSWEISVGALLSFRDYPALTPGERKALRRLAC